MAAEIKKRKAIASFNKTFDDVFVYLQTILPDHFKEDAEIIQANYQKMKQEQPNKMYDVFCKNITPLLKNDFYSEKGIQIILQKDYSAHVRNSMTQNQCTAIEMDFAIHMLNKFWEFFRNIPSEEQLTQCCSYLDKLFQTTL